MGVIVSAAFGLWLVSAMAPGSSYAGGATTLAEGSAYLAEPNTAYDLRNRAQQHVRRLKSAHPVLRVSSPA